MVEASIHEEFVAAVARATEAMKVGDPLDLSTNIGAVNSEPQLQQNLDFLRKAEQEGGEIVRGGSRILQETGGYFMDPAIVTGVNPRMQHWPRKEVFGPVLAVPPFEDEDAAARMANATVYGLAGAVWTSNLSPRAQYGPGGAHRGDACEHLRRCRRYSAIGRCRAIGQWGG